ncbi:unnamed protein product [Fraxinus pennsylvanica]|uniref:Uncharacterized protein n=1 Tax=Fraxinus pennsylvanica TaxID=56036 RepID=A0AAD2E8N4_9LAMI|nr:unnamed protein product [Fraxinus pennsylvanica]
MIVKIDTSQTYTLASTTLQKVLVKRKVLDDRNLLKIRAFFHFHLVLSDNKSYYEKPRIDNYFWIHLEKKVPTGAALVRDRVMPPQLYGQQISLVAVLPMKMNSNNGQIKLVRMSHSFSLIAQPTVQVEVRYVF